MTDTAERLKAGLAGRYRIERELGSGGMATVYLAEDLRHHRLIALKVLKPELSLALGPERFLREIDVAAHLQHPHILPLFDSGQLSGDSGLFYYVMPYVEGESLRARLDREKQLPIDDAIRLGVEIADALGAAHSQGVVHRDIKPENILVVGGHAVVADFGIARAVSAAGGQLTQAGMALGTPQYMSPEQATSSEVDGRADIYSLGCLVYEMLTGAPPFTGATAQAILIRHAIDAVPQARMVRASVPEGVERVLQRALAKVPADRYSTAREFGEALAGAAAAGPAPPPGGRRRRLLFGLLLGTGLAAAAVAWWGLGRTGSGTGAAAATPRRVAILPFANLSPDSGDAYLAQGLSEEIASRLGDFPEIRVAGRGSVERLERADSLDVTARARLMGYGYLVEGSVRRDRNLVRVAVRLVDAADGAHRWNHNYDRAATDLFALQDDVALDVARSVVGSLVPGSLPARSGPAPNPAAHDQLLQGGYYASQRNPRALARAVAAFGEAARRDSNFALAFAKLAHAHLLLLNWGWTYDGLSREALLDRGWAAAERAVQLDQRLADGWLARGSLLQFRNPVTLAGVREALQRAVELSPENAEVHHEFGMGLRLLDEDSSAALQFRRALEIEPDRPITLLHLGWIAMIGHRYDKARQWLDSAAAVNPGFYQAYSERAFVRLLVADTAGARADAQTAVRLRPDSDPLAAEDVLTALAIRQGDGAAASGRLARSRVLAPKPADAGIHQAAAWTAVLVAAGRGPEAVAYLEQIREDPTHLRMHLKEPRFDPLRDEPRFQALMDRLRVRDAAADSRGVPP